MECGLFLENGCAIRPIRHRITCTYPLAIDRICLRPRICGEHLKPPARLCRKTHTCSERQALCGSLLDHHHQQLPRFNTSPRSCDLLPCRGSALRLTSALCRHPRTTVRGPAPFRAGFNTTCRSTIMWRSPAAVSRAREQAFLAIQDDVRKGTLSIGGWRQGATVSKGGVSVEDRVNNRGEYHRYVLLPSRALGRKIDPHHPRMS